MDLQNLMNWQRILFLKNLKNALENIKTTNLPLKQDVLTWRSKVNISEINMEILTSPWNHANYIIKTGLRHIHQALYHYWKWEKTVCLTADSPKPIMLLYQYWIDETG